MPSSSETHLAAAFPPAWANVRTVVLASADGDVRSRLANALKQAKWRVCEVEGAAEAFVRLDSIRPEALLLDSWLPDLDVSEFCSLVERDYPALDVLRLDGIALTQDARSPRRHELLLALRDAGRSVAPSTGGSPSAFPALQETTPVEADGTPWGGLSELVGETEVMRELASLIRLVAPTNAAVLIQGETGTGKELVAQAIHRLSHRKNKPLAVLNCAAIPETLLEAELFGHVRGAFTGAVQSRTGRIVAADGGTLFLDEIGEMPLALQAKMLRFLECGEVQRVGENEVIRVNVRVVAATHRPLEQHAEDGLFRLDLYHRLAVFPIDVPPLRDRIADLALLAEHFLALRAEHSARKLLSEEALQAMSSHHWPGNVRELMHVLERACILSGQKLSIDPTDIRIRHRPR